MLKTLSLIFVLVAASCSPAMAKNSIAECESVANITASIAAQRDLGTEPELVFTILAENGVLPEIASDLIHRIYYLFPDVEPQQIWEGTYLACMSMDA